MNNQIFSPAVIKRTMEINEMIDTEPNKPIDKKPKGKGLHGNSEGHAAAGRIGGQNSSGNFKNNPERASLAGRLGGKVSPANFKHSPERARAAGRIGRRK